jgi:hypothetical protein
MRWLFSFCPTPFVGFTAPLCDKRASAAPRLPPMVPSPSRNMPHLSWNEARDRAIRFARPGAHWRALRTLGQANLLE